LVGPPALPPMALPFDAFLAVTPACPYPPDVGPFAAVLPPVYVLPAPPVLPTYFEVGGATLLPPIM